MRLACDARGRLFHLHAVELHGLVELVDEQEARLDRHHSGARRQLLRLHLRLHAEDP